MVAITAAPRITRERPAVAGQEESHELRNPRRLPPRARRNDNSPGSCFLSSSRPAGSRRVVRDFAGRGAAARVGSAPRGRRAAPQHLPRHPHPGTAAPGPPVGEIRPRRQSSTARIGPPPDAVVAGLPPTRCPAVVLVSQVGVAGPGLRRRCWLSLHMRPPLGRCLPVATAPRREAGRWSRIPALLCCLLLADHLEPRSSVGLSMMAVLQVRLSFTMTPLLLLRLFLMMQVTTRHRRAP